MHKKITNELYDCLSDQLAAERSLTIGINYDYWEVRPFKVSINSDYGFMSETKWFATFESAQKFIKDKTKLFENCMTDELKARTEIFEYLNNNQ